MPYETRLALCLLSELVSALRANDPDTFKQWLTDGVHELGEPGVAELMADWMVPLLSAGRGGHVDGLAPGGELS